MKEKDLEFLIPKYVDEKSKMEELKASVDDSNAKIKEIMEVYNLEEKCVNGIKAKVCISTKVTMDNDKLLVVLKTNLKDKGIDTSNLFYTKEFVNMDELERMLYNDVLPKNVVKLVANCKDEKEIKSLRISKDKSFKV